MSPICSLPNQLREWLKLKKKKKKSDIEWQSVPVLDCSWEERCLSPVCLPYSQKCPSVDPLPFGEISLLSLLMETTSLSTLFTLSIGAPYLLFILVLKFEIVHSARSVQVMEWLVLATSYHEVLSLNPTGGRIQFMTVRLHCTVSFIIIRPSPGYDLNNVERDVKHQTIIIIEHSITSLCV